MAGTAVRPAPALGAEVLCFEPRHRLLEATRGIALAGIVGGMTQARIRDLLLQKDEMLILGLAEIGEVERLLLHLLVEALERGPAIEQLGELILHLGGRNVGLQE